MLALLAMTRPTDPIDIVYTWVDDSFPGYKEQLVTYATDRRDSNPNRTRDNLDILRYSLRSVWQNMPEIRKIHILSMRPQVPAWLDAGHPKIEITHHDEIIDSDILPTFNSFCIVSHLHKLPGLSERFLYFEDDMLALHSDLLDAFFDTDGTPLLHIDKRKIIPRDRLNPDTDSPWNLALANMNALLDEQFGAAQRRHVCHSPHLLELEVCKQMCSDFADQIAITRKSKFRSGFDIPPEVMACYLAVETGAARIANDVLSRRIQGYVSIDNFLPWTWLNLLWMERRRPLSATLNDNFGEQPNRRVERLIRNRLERWFPNPAPWEYSESRDTASLR